MVHDSQIKGKQIMDGGVLEAQCRPNQPGFEGFPNLYAFRVVLVPTREKRGPI
jgi:hypothetical protein